MNFGQALNLAKAGKGFIRESFCNDTVGWGKGNTYIILNEKYMKFYMHDKNRVYEWMPSMSDLLANDYIEVTVPKEEYDR